MFFSIITKIYTTPYTLLAIKIGMNFSYIILLASLTL